MKVGFQLPSEEWSASQQLSLELITTTYNALKSIKKCDLRTIIKSNSLILNLEKFTLFQLQNQVQL